jgi:LPXTG-site transpeptidase (sortase) family protein
LKNGTVPAQLPSGVPGECYVEVDVTSYTIGNLINTIPAGELSSFTEDPESPGSSVPISNTTPASATLNVVGVESPSLSKAFAPNTVWAGETSTLSITVHNNDGDNPLTEVTLYDVLPSNGNGDIKVANPANATLSGCGEGSGAELTDESSTPGSLGPDDTTIKLLNGTIAPASDCVISVDVHSLVQAAYTNVIPAGPAGPGSIETRQRVTNESPADDDLNVQVFSLSKDFSETTIAAGQTTQVDIAIQNHATIGYTGASLDDVLPAGLEFVPGSAAINCVPTASTASFSVVSGANSNDTLRMTSGILPAETTCTITATVEASMSATVGTFTNDIPIGALTTDQGATNHTPASDSVDVQSLSVDKDFTETQIPIGGTSFLTITIYNPSPQPFTNAGLVDSLPDGLVFVNDGSATTDCPSGSVSIGPPIEPYDTLTLSGATLPSGSLAAPGSCTITAWVQSDPSKPPGNKTNTIPAGSITTDEGGTNDAPASDSITVTGLEIAKSFSPDRFVAGQTTTLTITITNPASVPFTDASISDTLPDSPIDQLYFTGTPWTTCTSGGAEDVMYFGVPPKTVTLTDGTIPADGSCTITATVTTAPDAACVPDPDDVNNIDYENLIPALALSTAEGATNDDPANAHLAVENLRVRKEFDDDEIAFPEATTLTIEIINPEGGEELTGVSFTDTLPDGLVIADPPNASTTCNQLVPSGEPNPTLTAVAGERDITLEDGSITEAPQGLGSVYCEVEVDVVPKQDTSAGDFTNVILRNAITTDEGKTNCIAADDDVEVFAVSVEKEFQYTSFEAGGSNELTITLTNYTGADYTLVAFDDVLPGIPDEELFFTGTPTTNCTSGVVSIVMTNYANDTIRLTNATIPAAADPVDTPGECEIFATVTTLATATDASYTNEIPIDEVTTDEGPQNKEAATDGVGVYTDGEGVTASKSFSPATIDIFDNSRLELSFQAPPDTDLNNFSFTDNLPSGVTVSNSTAPTATDCGTLGGDWPPADDATTIAATGGTILKGETCIVTVFVTSETGTTSGIAYPNTIAPAQITNTELRSTSGDITATLTVRTPSHLIIRKDFDPIIVGPDGRSRLTITLENEGAWALVDIDLDDILPGDALNGIVIAPDPNATTTCTGGVITADPGTQTIHMEDGSLLAQVGGVNGLCTINVNVLGKTTDGSTPATHTNTIPVSNVVATVDGTNSTMDPQGPASDDLTVKDLDLEIVKGFAPVLVYGGADSVMSIILRNPNASAELIDITFTDNMWLTDPDTINYPVYPDAVARLDYPVTAYPKGEMILIDPPLFDASDCGPLATLTMIDESTFQFSGGYLAPGDECTLTLRTTMTVNGNRTNTIPALAVTTFNGATNKTPTSATLTNLAGASISKSFAPNPVAAGLGSHSILTIEIRTTAAVIITGLGLVDTLPPGIVVSGAAAQTNSCGGNLTDENDDSLDAGDTIIKLSGGGLGRGFSRCFLTIPVSGAEPGDYNNEIPQGTLENNEGITNIQSTEDTLTLTPYSLGNRVWYDTDNDGVMDSGEVGVENVRVELYEDDGGTTGAFDGSNTFIKFDTTDADGYYRFDDLGGRDYIVVIPADNFRDVGGGDNVAGDPLAGYLSSGSSMDNAGVVSDSIGPGPDDDTDNEDNGVTSFSANTVDYVSATAVTLGPDQSEPLDDDDPTTNPETGEAANDQSNRTVDFGFYRQQLGNLVFHDVITADGAYSSGTDGLVEDATVQIFSSDGSGNEIAEINVGLDGIWGTADDAAGGMLTDSSGNYLFSGLPAGSYIVKVTPDGYRSTIDTANPGDTADPDDNIDNNDNGVGEGEGTIVSNEVTLTPGYAGAVPNNVVTNNTGTTYDPTVDFGFIPIVSIGSIVWEDTNRDGEQTAGEPGITGVTVTLLDGSGNPVLTVPTQTTVGDGLYYFGSLPEGNYQVRVEMPANYHPTINQNASDNDDSENDSNIATTNGNIYTSGTYNLTGDGEPDGVDSNIASSDDADDGLIDNGDDNNGNMTVDFGFVRYMSIGNRVFKDDGGPTGTGTLDNGIMDGDEEPFANVRVELYQDNGNGTFGSEDTLLNFDITNADGYYLFDQLDPGDYFVHIPDTNFAASGPLEGWYNSNPTGTENGGVAGNPYTPNTDRDDNGVNNINPQDNGITSGLLTLALESEPTLEAELSGDTTPAGDGFDPTAWDGPNSRGRFHESDLNSNLTVDFGFIPPLSLGNRVWIDDGAISASPGVDISQNDDGLMNGAEAGVENVLLNLYFDADGDGLFTNTDVDGINETVPYDTATTDADGFYLFDGLPEGRFYVQVDPDNFDTGDTLYRYRSSTDNGFGNQTVDLNDNGTDDSGYLTNGIRSIDFVLDYTGEPTAEADLPTNNAANQAAYGPDLRGRFGEEDNNSNLTLDFGFVQPHSIGNRVWRDSDNSGTINGIDDANPGIANVTVYLYAGVDVGGDGIPDDLTEITTTTTDADGYYLFGNLPAGDYIVGIPDTNFNAGNPLYQLRSSTGEPAQAKYTSAPLDGNVDSEDHGRDPATAGDAVYSPIINLANNEETGESDLPSDTVTYGPDLRGVNGELDENSDLTVDFGFFGGTDVPFSIGNHLWYDSGAGTGIVNNGVREASETLVAGARVELYRDGNGNGTLEPFEFYRFDVTNSDGFYLFDNLDPGDYYVRVAAGNFQDSFDPDGSGTDYASAPGVLRGWYSSQVTGDVETDTDDSDDNGIDVNFPETSGVTSSVVVLERGVNEPSGEVHLSTDTGINPGFNPTEDDGPASRGRFGESDATSNLTVDFGFIPPMSVGNRVWIDDGTGEATFGAGYNNGEMDGTEAGVENVEVRLYRGATLLDTKYTDSEGYYLFDRIQPGTNYTIVIAADNFDVGGPLEHYQSSTDANHASAPADDTEDLDDNGVDDAGYLTNGISSSTFSMEHSTEPTSATESDYSSDTVTYGPNNVGRYGQGDDDSNLTFDFGFFRPRSLGNRLWFDTDNDRIMDGAEQPVPDGVRVSLYLDEDTNGTPDGPALRWDTTDAGGYYLFDNLPPRNYLVGVDASNFQSGGILVGYYSSTGNRTDPLDSDDRRDNGIDQTSPQSSTYGILSPTIDLTGDSPTSESDLSSDTGTGFGNNPTEDDGPNSRGRYGESGNGSNLTIDFGFYKVEIGNLVYRDDNANGTYDAGTDTLLDSVLVQLFESDGSGNITGEIITGADGILNTADDGWGPDGINGTGDDGDGGINTGGSFGSGEYLFSGLPAGDYTVRATTPSGHVSTIDSNPQNDNDNPDVAADNNDNGVGVGLGTKDQVDSAELTMDGGEQIAPALDYDHPTGTTTDTSVDFGFTYAYALGNRVWYDTDNSSAIDNGEGDDSGTPVGVDGVRVELYAADVAGMPTGSALATITTANGGYYLFDYLTADEYVVVIPASNFNTGAVLAGYWSSATAMATDGSLTEGAPPLSPAPDPDDPGADTIPGTADDDIDSDDNGTRQTSGGFNSAVISQAVTLGNTVASEPTGETDLDGGTVIGDQPDSRSNMKLDFGFYKTEIGNLVFVDADKSGHFNTGDSRLSGVTMRLYSADGTEIQVGPDDTFGTSDDSAGDVLTDVQTDINGNYQFHGLPAGDYIVKATTPNGAVSTIDSNPQSDNDNPNGNIDHNDNGLGITNGDANGLVTSNTTNTLTMTPGAVGAANNNIVDDGSGTTFNPTLDFGFIEAVAIGNRVWFDTGSGSGTANNGIQDGTESGADSVRVELYAAGADGAVGGGDDVSIGFDMTDASGNYVFDQLIPDKYYLFIPETQFDDAGDTLFGYMSTQSHGTDETLDQDTDENGIDENDLAANGIYSPVYDLQPNNEPDATDVETEYTGSLDDDNVNFTADFGFLEYVAIGNRVWFDTGAGTDFNDGEFDAGEVGVNEVTVNLFDSGDNLIDTTTTADYGGVPGYYEFDMLPPGEYYVSIPAAEFGAGGDLLGYVSSTPTGSDETTDNNSDENGIDADPSVAGIRSNLFDLQPNIETTTDDQTNYSGVLGDSDVNFTADFGFVNLTAIGNRVWFDTGDGVGIADNGIQDGIETGAPDVTVELYRSGGSIGSPYRTTITDANGDYQFDLLNPGDYFVHIPAAEFQSGGDLEGYASSSGNGGVNDDDDQNLDENGIDSTTLPADGISTPVYTLGIGTEPTGDDQTSYTGYLDNGNVNFTADFGFLQKVAIGNRVWLDIGGGGGIANNGMLDGSEAGIDDVTVELHGYGPDDTEGTADDIFDTTTTSGGGYYVFDNLMPGYYYLNIPASEFQSGGDVEGLLSSTDNGSDESTNEADDENGIDNATPEAAVGGGIRSTLFELTLGGEQTGEDQSNYTGSLRDENVNFTADFALSQLVAIGNRVWLDTGAGANYNNGILDAGETPLDGVTVDLYGVGPDGTAGTVDDTSHGSVFTAGGGYYEFDRLLPGQYYVSIPASEFNGTEELVGYVSTTTTGADETTDETGDENGIDADVASDGIRTQVYDLRPNTEPTTDDETNYSGTLDDNNVNFTADLSFVKLVALGNRVWFDTGAGSGIADNGIQDGTESGVDGVRVELYGLGPDGTAGTPDDNFVAFDTTDANGDYYFDLLNPDSYYVSIPSTEFDDAGDALFGYVSSTGNGGVDDDDDQDADENGIDGTDLPTEGIRTPVYTLTPELEPTADIDTGYTGYLDDDNVNLTADFGFLQKVAIGNRVWLDTGAGTNYNNGILDADESGQNGVTVNLYDSSDNLVDTTSTADYAGLPGYYQFDNLLPGQYYISIPASEFNGTEELVGYVSTTTTGADETTDESGDENGIDADVAANGIRTQIYDLQPNNEPTSDVQVNYTGTLDNDNVNFTADLSFVRLVGLGNRVWSDSGEGAGGIFDNGIQDGSEAGISDVTVELYRQGDTIGSPYRTTTTDADGNYQFDLLNPGQYFVHIPAVEFQSGGDLEGYASSTGNGGVNDDDDQNSDENGIDSTSLPVDGIRTPIYTLDIGLEPTSDDQASYTGYLDTRNVNFTADFGFLPKWAIGNRVWFDTNNDARINNPDEEGVSGVTVELYDANSMTKIDTGPDGIPGTADDGTGDVTTDSNGYYLFDYLNPGEYVVVLPASNFSTGVLQGYWSSQTTRENDGNLTETTAPDPDTDFDSDDNGTRQTSGALSDAVISAAVTLGTAEPTLEADLQAVVGQGDQPDAQANMTVDFGFYTMTLGNLVWIDDDNSGLVNGAEAGVDDVTLELWSADGSTRFDSVITSGGGAYAFTGLAQGDYLVRIPAGEFQGTEELVDYVTSTGALLVAPTTYEYEPAPDADVDTTDADDNGSQKGGITGNGGYIQSEVVTLSPILEASYDNATGTTTEDRLDFGVTPENRSYTIAKTVTDVGGDGAGGSVDEAGDVISYQVEVVNTGNQILTGVTLADSLVASVGSPTESGAADGYLEIGETWTWTFTYTATQADLDDNGGGDGDIDNTATVSSNELPDESDSQDVPIIQTPEITLTKSGSFDDNDGNSEADPAETISYTFTVENTGNLTLTDVTIDDPDFTVNGGPIASMAPGDSDSSTFTGTYAINQTEIDAGQKVNTATATGKDPDNNDVPDDDTHTQPLPQAPSLALVKEVSTDGLTWFDDSVTVEEGASVFFRIRVENTGNTTLTNLVVDDGMAACTPARAADITGNNDNVFEVGEEWSYTCVVTAVVGINTNTASADTDETGPPVEDDAEYRSLPDISLLKSVDDASPAVGDIITFTIKVTNKGLANATNIVVEDIVPDGFTYQPGSITGGDSRDQSDPAGSGLTWTINNLNRDVTVTLTFQAQVNGSGTFKNVAEVVAAGQPDPDSTPDNDDGDQSEDDEDSVTANPTIDAADLELSKSVDNSSPAVGDLITFTIRVTNEGPDTATNVSVTDVVPDGFNYQANSITGGNSRNDLDPAGSGLVWTINSLDAGVTVELRFEATVNASGTFKNVAQVTAADQSDPDSTPDNDKGDQVEDDEDSATASPNSNAADLRLAKVVNDAAPSVGDTLTFTITVTNEGPDTATSVEVRDVVPDGFSYAAGTISGGDSQDDANPDSSGLVWTITSLANGDSVDLSFDADVNAAGDYTNVAQVTDSDQNDIDSTPDNDDGDQSEDDEDSATATPSTGSADLSLVKSVDESSPDVGDTVTFTLTLTNSGPDTATNVAVTDIVPTGFSYVSGTIEGGNSRNESDPDGSGLVWSITSLNNGDSVELRFQATVEASGNYTNVAQVTASDQDDIDSTPDNDDGDHSEDDENAALASPPADLFLSKTVDNLGAQPGDTVVFTVTVRNDGPNDATGIEVGDQFPDGYNFVSANPSQGSYDDATGIWNVGDIDDGDLATLEITATVNAVGNFTNIAQVTAADQQDPDSTPDNDDGDQSEDDEASATIASTHVFDPPSGWKTVDANGWPLLVWRQVWINNGNLTAFPVQVVDDIPNGTTYIANSLTCETEGLSSTTRCEYDPINNRIIWEGSIAPDFGAQNEQQADHEVVITFSTTTDADVTRARNQGLAFWDENDDGVIDANDANVANNAPMRTDNPATLSPGDATYAGPPDPDDSGGGDGKIESLSLPGTGFAPGRETVLTPPDKLDIYREYSAEMVLEIPSLDVTAPIVGVPLEFGEWNTDWLLAEAGYLEGTAFPTTSGNTALSAHAYLPSGKPGPFLGIDQLIWGDEVRINTLDAVYVYEVHHREFVAPDDLSVLTHEEDDWITLITCYQYDEALQGYRWRTVVKAVLVEVVEK